MPLMGMVFRGFSFQSFRMEYNGKNSPNNRIKGKFEKVYSEGDLVKIRNRFITWLGRCRSNASAA
jgi:hypothetical protein